MVENDKTHIRITSEGDVFNTQIYINGKKLSRVIKIVIDAYSGHHKPPIVKIDIVPEILEVDGDFKELIDEKVESLSIPNAKILLCARCRNSLNQKNSD